MKFASIYLSNYIGIYNGMGLYEMHIDMTKCKNRIVIIRGDNGSGKSTLMKALNLFPDSNDSFIPGLPARKEIVLVDNETLYKLVFIHGIKANGERDVTKAYITKTFNNKAVELNENGNVSSYKDILYTELGLDANFAALSQLSNDDRGLADKRPADRKKFVNSIISSLDTYNNIYKTLTKRSSNYKSMINAIVAKLNILGDERTLADNLGSLENRINGLQDMKDQAVTKLAKENSLVTLLDPDGSIQNTNNTIEAELALAEKEYNSIENTIKKIMADNGISTADIESACETAKSNMNSLMVQNQISRNTIESLMREKESEASELNQKLQKLATLQSGYSYENLKEKVAEYKQKLLEIKEELVDKVGIEDMTSLSKEEYILALETLKDLENYISTFKSYTDFSIIERIIKEYNSTGEIPKCIDIRVINNRLDNIDTELNNVNNQISVLLSKMGLLDKLNLRPSNCKIDSCEFIKEALDFSKSNPKEELNTLQIAKESLENEKVSLKEDLRVSEVFNDAVNMFTSIVREVNKNGAILSKMPNGDMFKNKALFFDRLLSGYSFEYMKDIYSYIDLANLFDVYKQTMSIYDEYMAEVKVYESKAEMIDSINADIEKINKAISVLVDKIEPINQEIYDRESKIFQLQQQIMVYESILAQLEAQKPYKEKIDACRSRLLENSRKMNDINAALARSVAAKEEITQISYSLEPLMKERDKVSHSVQMLNDYLKEKEELETSYQYLETIKYYSSPTTGIQLVFMELYMGKIIALANELLKLLFGGTFAIQPFIINESEFRIPCLGNGYLNDDISSMSSAQIGMISMILSFALLHHSSTKYNIIKLDEIDGPLDYNNRVFFTDVLHKIMDIMGTEQCIMISHNTEIQNDDFDLILLKQEGDAQYTNGNIIWKY